MAGKVRVHVRGAQGESVAGDVMPGAGKAQGPLVVQAKGLNTIELRDIDKNVAPQKIVVTRKGKSLQVWLDETDTTGQPDIVVEGYYDQENIALVGVAEGGTSYSYVPVNGDAAHLAGSLPEATQVGEHLASRVLSDLPPLLERCGSLDDLEALLNRPLQSSPFYSKPARAGLLAALAALLERADWPQLAESLEQAMPAARPAQHHFAKDLQSQDELRCAEILAALRGRLPFSARERQLAREIAWLD